MEQTKRLQPNKIKVLLLFSLVWEMVFPHYATQVAAAEMSTPVVKDMQAEWSHNDYSEPVLDEVKPKYIVTKSLVVDMTAYSSDPAQTDSTPCITANGFDVCKNDEENVIATNFLPFGTKVRIPDQFGDTVFTVHDRMNKRYTNRVDVWKKSKQSAIQFGYKRTKIEVLKEAPVEVAVK